MANKLVKDIDEEIWRKFVAYCKLQNITVGNQLDQVLKEFLEKNFDKLFIGK